MNLSEFLGIVDDMHTRVSTGHGRIEITRDGCDDVCILISKRELESLERALEIFSETPDFKAMCESLINVAASAGIQPAVQTL